MATYEFKPDFGEGHEIKRLLAEQVALGLNVSLEPPTGPFWRRTFVFSGATADLEAWHAALSAWKWDKQMSNLV